MSSRSLTADKEETTQTKSKPQKQTTKHTQKTARAKHYGGPATKVKRTAVASTKPSVTSAIRLSKIGFQPIEKIRSLPEYAAAGLRETDTSKYLPSLSINTVEEFLGLIRGAPMELAEDLGTTEDKLVNLYNAAVASQLPAMSSETIEDLLEEEYSFGLSLEAPPEQSEAASLAVSPDIEMDVSASDSLAASVSLAEETISLIDENMPLYAIRVNAAHA